MLTDQKSVLCSNLIKEIYDIGSYIFKKGEKSSCLYIIKEGEVNCSINGKVVRILKKGDHFGEKSILMDSNRSLDCIAKTNCIIYSISIETLKKIIGENYRDILFLNFVKLSLNQSQYFNKIDNNLIENTFSHFNVNNYTKDKVVITKGFDISTKLIIIIEGGLYDVHLFS